MLYFYDEIINFYYFSMLFHTTGYFEFNAQVPAACSYHSSQGLQPLWTEEGFLLYLCLYWNTIHGSDCLSKPKGETDLLMTSSWFCFTHWPPLYYCIASGSSAFQRSQVKLFHCWLVSIWILTGWRLLTKAYRVCSFKWNFLGITFATSYLVFRILYVPK